MTERSRRVNVNPWNHILRTLSKRAVSCNTLLSSCCEAREGIEARSRGAEVDKALLFLRRDLLLEEAVKDTSYRR